jgi:pimeloyl-ACP methyl ester carboxylesterase
MDRARHTGRITIEAYGVAVARALTNLELPPAILVGHSMGCRVVLEASRVQPDAVSGLVFVDGSRISEGDPIADEQAMTDELAGTATRDSCGSSSNRRSYNTRGLYASCAGQLQGLSPET